MLSSQQSHTVYELFARRDAVQDCCQPSKHAS